MSDKTPQAVVSAARHPVFLHVSRVALIRNFPVTRMDAGYL